MKKTALLIIDVQSGLIKSGIYNSENLIKNLKLLKVKAEKNSIETIYVIHDDGKGSELEYGTPSWEIYEEIKPYSGEKIFNKKYNSAFKETGLKEYLNGKGVERLVISGLQAEYCINFSLIAALEYGYEIIIPVESISTCDGPKFSAMEINDFYYNVIWKDRVGKVLDIEEIIWK